MFWEYKNNKIATETFKKIFIVDDQGVMIDCKSETFSKFISSNMIERPEHTLDLNQDALRELVECNLHKSTQELTFDLNTLQSIICCHL